eukprot:scaffold4235_cov114-Isochrysis_galbana.AAC.6
MVHLVGDPLTAPAAVPTTAPPAAMPATPLVAVRPGSGELPDGALESHSTASIIPQPRGRPSNAAVSGESGRIGSSSHISSSASLSESPPSTPWPAAQTPPVRAERAEAATTRASSSLKSSSSCSSAAEENPPAGGWPCRSCGNSWRELSLDDADGADSGTGARPVPRATTSPIVARSAPAAPSARA